MRIVFIGAGHSNTKALLMLSKIRPDYEFIVISPSEAAYYSGMLPGCVAGFYSIENVSIPLQSFCERLNATFLCERVVRIDTEKKLIFCLDKNEGISYDYASVNIGSDTFGKDVEGVMEFTIPTRPIDSFLNRLENAEKTLENVDLCRVFVIGAGAAGFELACALSIRLRTKKSFKIILIDKRTQFTGKSEELCALKRLKIEYRPNTSVTRVTESFLHVEASENASDLPYELVIWACGPKAHREASNLGLTVSVNYISVRRTLQTVDSDCVFAVGDCCNLIDYPNTPKAGVYAVRMAEILWRNIIALCDGKRLREYTPQRGFLSLLMSGEKRAIGKWKGMCLEGKLMWLLKDWIDRQWMQQFDLNE